MTKKLNEIIATVAFAGALLAPTISLAENGYVNLRTAFNKTQNHPTMRVEWGKDITDKLSTPLNFFDINSSRENKNDFDVTYVEGRVEYKLDGFSIDTRAAVQYEIGTGMKPIIRTGFTFRPKTNESNFTLLKLYPYETTGQLGPSAILFTSQDIGKKLYAELYFHYNAKSKDYLVWPEVGVKITDNLRFFIQDRCSGKHLNDKCDVVSGVKYSYNF